MRRRGILGRWGRALGALALAAIGVRAQTAGAAAQPAFALLDGADAAQWQSWASSLGWTVVAPEGSGETNPDRQLRALVTAVSDAVRAGRVDETRVYLAGRGDAANWIAYGISRVPGVWAAGLALGGSPRPSIATSRVYTANFKASPLLWVSEGAADSALAVRLKDEGLGIEYRNSSESMARVFEWLASHRREADAEECDCEISLPAFARCGWVEVTGIDPAERNDVLPSTLLAGAATATLDLGSFSYEDKAGAAGITVKALAAGYSGPLKAGDRIVALDGRPIADTAALQAALGTYTGTKPAVVTVERGKERVRIETRVVMPRRDAAATVRVSARHLAAEDQIEIVSRGATAMRVTLPAAWLPATLFWNGLSIEELKTPGCVQLTVEKELLHSAKCP